MIVLMCFISPPFQLTYKYRGIKEVSEASDSIPDMDIVVYAQGFYYPTVSSLL